MIIAGLFGWNLSGFQWLMLTIIVVVLPILFREVWRMYVDYFTIPLSSESSEYVPPQGHSFYETTPGGDLVPKGDDGQN